MPSAWDLDDAHVEGAENDNYNLNHKHALATFVSERPRASVHSREWRKIMNGDPVEINPSLGHGLKIQTVDEYVHVSQNSRRRVLRHNNTTHSNTFLTK